MIKQKGGEPKLPEGKIQPVIDASRCKACGLCIAFCNQNVFEADNLGRPIAIAAENCSGCLMCDYRCPDFAISLDKESPK